MEEKREVIKTEEQQQQQQQVCKVDKDHKEDDGLVLPGYRFHPTDEELVGFYLQRKVEKKGFCIDIIKEIDIYKHDPWDLPKVGSGGEKEWFFFCLRGRKYRNSVRPNRVTASGFWKATGIDKPIYSSSSDACGDCVGLKKSLVYYKGSAGKGVKTDWLMHEFRLPSSGNHTDHNSAIPCMQEAEVWTLCRIIKRNASSRPSRTSWKASINMIDPVPSDSSSKTNSFESDCSTQYEYNFLVPSLSYPETEIKCNGSSYAQNHDSLISANQYWNSIPQAPPTPTVTHFKNEPNPNYSDDCFLKDGDWDELGRVVEFMADHNGASYCEY